MTEPLTLQQIRGLVRTVPDFPKPGIQFRDITTLIGSGPGLASTIQHLADRIAPFKHDAIAGMEARGFIFGAAVAARLGAAFIPIRKPGKLPVETIHVDYELEYGTDRLELDPTGIKPGQSVIIVDDLIATGGTAEGAVKLLRKAGARVDHAHFVIDLPDLGGASRLANLNVRSNSLLAFAGD